MVSALRFPTVAIVSRERSVVNLLKFSWNAGVDHPDVNPKGPRSGSDKSTAFGAVLAFASSRTFRFGDVME